MKKKTPGKEQGRNGRREEDAAGESPPRTLLRAERTLTCRRRPAWPEPRAQGSPGPRCPYARVKPAVRMAPPWAHAAAGRAGF